METWEKGESESAQNIGARTKHGLRLVYSVMAQVKAKYDVTQSLAATVAPVGGWTQLMISPIQVAIKAVIYYGTIARNMPRGHTYTTQPTEDGKDDDDYSFGVDYVTPPRLEGE